MMQQRGAALLPAPCSPWPWWPAWLPARCGCSGATWRSKPHSVPAPSRYGILTGALDWARLILREDARSGGADHLGEPWAVPLAEARLSTFLAANASDTDLGDSAEQVFLSGSIQDLQGRLNVFNLVDGGKISQPIYAASRACLHSLACPAPNSAPGRKPALCAGYPRRQQRHRRARCCRSAWSSWAGWACRHAA